MLLLLPIVPAVSVREDLDDIDTGVQPRQQTAECGTRTNASFCLEMLAAACHLTVIT